MTVTVVVAGARTPIGKLLGGVASLSAAQLGAFAIAAAVDRAGLKGDAIDTVIMGQVIQAGAGQNPARKAAVLGGLPLTVSAITLNKVCLSGMSAIALGDLLIRSGEAKVVVAGGMESMSGAPHFVRGVREGQKFGDLVLEDAISEDALRCAIDDDSMGDATEAFNSRYGVTRDRQDAIAVLSHQRAAAADFADEIVKVGDFASDEGVRPNSSVEGLAKLRPAFGLNGTITAGNASQLSDGAAAVVLMSRDTAVELGLEWQAEIVATASVAGPDTSLHEQPANAILAALAKAGLAVADVDFFEINEAFAQVVAVSQEKLGVPDEVVNLHGGAIALGHPVGMSGARIVLHAASELARRGAGVAAAGICGGGGQGEAILLRARS